MPISRSLTALAGLLTLTLGLAACAQAAPTEAPAPTGEPEAAEAPAEPAAGAQVFAIVPEESEVRFQVGEILRGEPFTVIGVSNAVSGEITADFANPAAAQVGTITIDPSMLITDNNFRNGAIRNQILQTGRFATITFAPTEVTGLPQAVTVGEAFTVQITGDLTIRDITNPVTFEVTVTPVSETRLEGSGRSEIMRGDFELTIPQVPQVAGVDENVILEIDFVAEAG